MNNNSLVLSSSFHKSFIPILIASFNFNNRSNNLKHIPKRNININFIKSRIKKFYPLI